MKDKAEPLSFISRILLFYFLLDISFVRVPENIY